MICPPLLSDKVYEDVPLFQTMPTTLEALKVIVPLAALVLVNTAVFVDPGTLPRDQLPVVLQAAPDKGAVLFQSFSVPVMI